MKKLKPNQLGPWCSYCTNEHRKRAVYAESGRFRKFCCDEHKQNLMDFEKHESDMDNYSEADYETWMGL